MTVIPKLPTLKPGDKVYTVTPASAVEPEQVAEGIAMLASFGIECVTAPNAFERNGIVAGTIEERQSDLYQALQNDDTAGIWCLRGGYGSVQLLSTLDFNLFLAHPKLMIGFSDLTAFQWAIFQRIKFPTLSGFPVTLQVSEKNPFLNTGMDVVFGRKQSVSWDDLPDEDALIHNDGKAEGVLVGGTLSMICSICGTPFWPEDDDYILFLEDVGEPLYRIDRCLQQLKLTGFLENVRGLVLGKFLYQDGFLDVLPLILSLLPPDIPIVYNFPYGHIAESFPMPMGVRARLKTNPFQLSWAEIVA